MGLTCKARLLAGGSRNEDPVRTTYTGVVLMETVRIALTYADLNGLVIFSDDTRNTYLTAPTTDKIFSVCGHKFGSENIGRKVIVKIPGIYFRNHLRD